METYFSLSENWSKEQTDVWQNVLDHWDRLIEGNIEEFLKYIHPKFVGFGHESPLPVDRGWLEHWVGFWGKNMKFLIHALKPIHIVIHDDIAIVQYCIFVIAKGEAEKGNRTTRRYTMTWKKQKDRWIVIGSHNNLMEEKI